MQKTQIPDQFAHSFVYLLHRDGRISPSPLKQSYLVNNIEQIDFATQLEQ